MIDTFKCKPVVNKNNNQMNFSIPKREIKIFKDEVPKFVTFKIQKVEWK